MDEKQEWVKVEMVEMDVQEAQDKEGVEEALEREEDFGDSSG